MTLFMTRDKRPAVLSLNADGPGCRGRSTTNQSLGSAGKFTPRCYLIAAGLSAFVW